MTFKDYLHRIIDGIPFFDMSTCMEEHFPKIKGEIFWQLEDTITGEITKGKLKNVVTLDASILIARLLKTAAAPIAHQSEPSFGILALAVGTGYVSWDLQDPPPATITQRSLWNEIGRKQIQSSQYVTSLGLPSGVPTNIIDLTTTFSISEAVGPITEMGLIGGDSDINMVKNPVFPPPPNGPYDSTFNMIGFDTLVNYVTFPVINKNASSTLSWTWRLTL